MGRSEQAALGVVVGFWFFARAGFGQRLGFLQDFLLDGIGQLGRGLFKPFCGIV